MLLWLAIGAPLWAQEAHTADLTLSVNVSARQFHQPEFVQEVQAAVAKHPVVVVGMGMNPFPKKARRALDGAGVALGAFGQNPISLVRQPTGARRRRLAHRPAD